MLSKFVIVVLSLSGVSALAGSNPVQSLYGIEPGHQDTNWGFYEMVRVTGRPTLTELRIQKQILRRARWSSSPLFFGVRTVRKSLLLPPPSKLSIESVKSSIEGFSQLCSYVLFERTEDRSSTDSVFKAAFMNPSTVVLTVFESSDRDMLKACTVVTLSESKPGVLNLSALTLFDD